MPTIWMAVLFCDEKHAAQTDSRCDCSDYWPNEQTQTTVFRQRLLNKPFALGQPVVEDSRFNAAGPSIIVLAARADTINSWPLWSANCMAAARPGSKNHSMGGLGGTDMMTDDWRC